MEVDKYSQRRQLLEWCPMLFKPEDLMDSDRFVSIIDESAVKSYLYHPDMEALQPLITESNDSKKNNFAVTDILDLGIFDEDSVFLPKILNDNKDKRNTWYKYNINDADFSQRMDGVSPLALACYHGMPQIVTLLLSVLNHSPNIQSSDGSTPMMETIAGTSGDEDQRLQCLQQLLKYGASVKCQHKSGHNVLTLSCYTGKEPYLKLLDAASSTLDWNHQTKMGHTPLMFAVYSENLEVIEYLINSKKVDAAKKNFNYLTALDLSLLLNLKTSIKGLLAMHFFGSSNLKEHVQNKLYLLKKESHNENIQKNELMTLFISCLLTITYLGRFKQVRHVILEEGMLDNIIDYHLWESASIHIKSEFCLNIAAHLFFENDKKGMTKLMKSKWAEYQFQYESDKVENTNIFFLDRFMAIISFFICADNGFQWICETFLKYPKLALKYTAYDLTNDAFVEGFYKEVMKIMTEFNIEDGFKLYSGKDKLKMKQLESGEKDLKKRVKELVPVRNDIIAFLLKKKTELRKLKQNHEERHKKASKSQMKTPSKDKKSKAKSHKVDNLQTNISNHEFEDNSNFSEDATFKKIVTKKELRRMKKQAKQKILSESIFGEQKETKKDYSNPMVVSADGKTRENEIKMCHDSEVKNDAEIDTTVTNQNQCRNQMVYGTEIKSTTSSNLVVIGATKNKQQFETNDGFHCKFQKQATADVPRTKEKGDSEIQQGNKNLCINNTSYRRPEMKTVKDYNIEGSNDHAGLSKFNSNHQNVLQLDDRKKKFNINVQAQNQMVANSTTNITGKAREGFVKYDPQRKKNKEMQQQSMPGAYFRNKDPANLEFHQDVLRTSWWIQPNNNGACEGNDSDSKMIAKMNIQQNVSIDHNNKTNIQENTTAENLFFQDPAILDMALTSSNTNEDINIKLQTLGLNINQNSDKKGPLTAEKQLPKNSENAFPSASHDPIPPMLLHYLTNSSNALANKGVVTKPMQHTVSNESGYLSPLPTAQPEVKPVIPMFVRNWGKGCSKRWSGMLKKLVQSPMNEITRAGTINFLNNDNQFISKGSCGTVVRVGIRDDGMEVAVKCMVKVYTQLISNELKSLKELQHANIIQYKDYVEDANFAYVALELCEFTLDEYVYLLVKRNQLSQHSQRICVQFMSGLKALHDAKVLHMDLKPRNVLIDLKGDVRLADFGLSHRLKEEQSTFYHTSVHGTKCWRAPETLSVPYGSKDENYGRYKQSTDIYVAAMILYFVVTGGRHPFGEDSSLCEANILKGYLPDISILQDEIFVSVFNEMIHPDMDKRITTDECIAHPFFWDNKKKFQFLVCVARNHDVIARVSNELLNRIEFLLVDKPSTAKWALTVHPSIVRYMGWQGLHFNSVLDILTILIPEFDERQQSKEKPRLEEVIGQQPSTFVLTKFPGLFMTVYESVIQVGWQRKHGIRDFFQSEED